MKFRKRETANQSPDEKIMHTLAGWLPRDNVVRQFAEAILAGEQQQSDRIPTLCWVINESFNMRWYERSLACWCLAECVLPPEHAVRTCIALRAALSSALIRTRPGRIRVIADTVGHVCKWTILIGIASPLSRFVSPIILYLFLLTCFTAATASLVRGSRSKIDGLLLGYCSAIRGLVRLGDPHAVGEIAKVMLDDNAEIRAEAEKALPALLEAVRNEHYGLLPTEATPALCKALVSWQQGISLPNGMDTQHIDLGLQILCALGRAGDGSAAKPVRGIAKSSQSDSIRKKALEILPILEERLRQETAAARLLRPAESPTNPAEVLLRPAGSATAVPDEQLLRSSVGPTDGST